MTEQCRPDVSDCRGLAAQLDPGAGRFADMQSTVIAELLEAENARRRALVAGDISVLALYVSDDLILVHTTGVPDSKPMLLQKIATRQLRYTSIDQIEGSAYVIGPVGIHNGLMRMSVEVNSVTRQLCSRTLGIWLLDQGRWMLRQYQATSVPDVSKQAA